VEGERLARVGLELLDLGHTPHGQARHDRVRANLLGQPGRAGRCLRRDGMAFEQRHTATTPRQMEGDAGAERSGANHDDLGFVNHGSTA